MTKTASSILLMILVTATAAVRADETRIRRAVWDGQFYEQSPARLAAQVDGFIGAGTKLEAGRTPVVIIAPHAGYPYSGRVAGKAYATVAGADFETVVIVAPSHRAAYEGCSVDEFAGFATPLGVAPIDTDVIEALKKEAGFDYVAEAHASEHALEVQIPFIQRALPKAKIVPIIMGHQTKKTIQVLAEALIRVSKSKKILVVASSDMSHFLTKKEANVLDASTIALVKSLAIEQLIRKVERQENILCGGGPVMSALIYAQKKGPVEVEVLEYADSSEAGTPESKVVGYFSAAVSSKAGSEVSFSLSKDEKKELVRLARQAVQEAVESGLVLKYEPNISNLKVFKGGFVTLTKKGTLRGCIGFIEPIYPLCQTVIQAAYYAALEDRRFGPVTANELKDLEIEVSVLSPLTRITRHRPGRPEGPAPASGRRGKRLDPG